MELLLLRETSMTLTEIDKQMKENPERLHRMYFFIMEIKKEEARKLDGIQNKSLTTGGKDIVRVE